MSTTDITFAMKFYSRQLWKMGASSKRRVGDRSCQWSWGTKWRTSRDGEST